MRTNWKVLACLVASTALFAVIATDLNAGEKKGAGSGKTRIGVSIDDWDEGVGQPTYNFTTAERYGIKIGLRPVERFGDFNLPLVKDGQTGVYIVPNGTFSDGASSWGYSIYVNVEGAFGVAKGTTLEDYDIEVIQDYDNTGDWYGTGLDSTTYFDVESTYPTGEFPGFGNDDPYKYQQSWAPTFGTTGFDTDAEAAYTITLALIPKTFNGPPLSVTVVAIAMAP